MGGVFSSDNNEGNRSKTGGGDLPRSNTFATGRQIPPSSQKNIKKPQAHTPDGKKKDTSAIEFAMNLAKSAADGIKKRIDLAATITPETKLSLQIAALTELQTEAKTTLDQITKGYEKIGQSPPDSLKYDLATPFNPKEPMKCDIHQYATMMMMIVQSKHQMNNTTAPKEAKQKSTPPSPESQVDSQAEDIPDYLRTPPPKTRKKPTDKKGGASYDSPASGGERGFLQGLKKQNNQSPGSDSDHDDFDPAQSRGGSRADPVSPGKDDDDAGSDLDSSFTAFKNSP